MDNPSSPPNETNPTPTPPTPAVLSVGGASISTPKLFAILSYALIFVGLPFCIVPLVMRDDEFSLFHAKQASGIACLQLGAGLFWLISMLASVVFPPMICVAAPVVFGVAIGALVLHVVGLVNAASDKQVPVPWVGKLIDDAFKGLRVKRLNA